MVTVLLRDWPAYGRSPLDLEVLIDTLSTSCSGPQIGGGRWLSCGRHCPFNRVPQATATELKPEGNGAFQVPRFNTHQREIGDPVAVMDGDG